MSDDYYKQIPRGPEFDDLYADSGTPPAEAPRHRSKLKFRTAVEQFDDIDLQAIREYDRAKYGGFVNG